MLFLGLTMEKLKAGIFDGPQIRQLVRDPEFENSMTEVEQETWKVFVLVINNFLGNNKARNYAEIVMLIMLTAFRNLGCNMSVKMHYLFLHMDRFPKNLGSMCDEIPSGPERDGDQVSVLLRRNYDGWLQLESKQRPPCHWGFQEFEETEFQALKFEQWWSNMQFTCTYLYQCPPFSLQ